MKQLFLACAMLAFSVTGCQMRDDSVDISSMDDETLLDRMSDIAFEKMDDADDDLSKVDEPFRTVAIIYSAQGVIDNGGLVYFFENDWPRKPPYSVYADAYERIGRIDAAAAIREAASSFGFDSPERYVDKRREYIERHYDEDSFCVDGWNDCICGDEQVWSNLAAWVRKNQTQ